MTRTRHLPRRLLVLAAALSLAAAPMLAGTLRLGGRPHADRPSATPLRQIDLGRTLDGKDELVGWAEALSRLPARCGPGSAVESEPCDDDLRCGWLAARARAAEAWRAGGASTRRSAAESLQRYADRLGAGGTCGLDGEDALVWQADREAAALDAALYEMALVARSGRAVASEVPIIDANDQKRIVALASEAAQSGFASLPEEQILALRPALRRFSRRAAWLDDQPAIDSLRRLLVTRWAPLGGVPRGCGERLLEGNLLSDQWRGLVVRDAAPEALTCLADRLIREADRRGRVYRDGAGAARLARALAEQAARDPGGRTFGRDRAVVRNLALIDQMLEVSETRGAARAKTSDPAPSRAAGTPSPGPRAVTKPPQRPEPPRQPAPQAAAGSETAASAARAAPPVRTRPSAELIGLAGRVATVIGSDRGLVAAAREARDQAGRERFAERLHVELHRELCAPLASALPEDLSAVRAVLARLGVRADERACEPAEFIESVRRLLAAAGSLRSLRAAVALRHAARLVAVGREPEALQLLDGLPRETRGTTWAIVRAWALRRSGDHVEAARTLATLDNEVIDELRAAGDEDVARLAAHAWATPQR